MSAHLELVQKLKSEMLSRWGGHVTLSGAFEAAGPAVPESNDGTGLWAQLRAGSLSEISGPHGGGKTEWLIRELAEHEPAPAEVAWLEGGSWNLYPLAFVEHALGLERVLFVELGNDFLSGLGVTAQVLRSQIFSTVVLQMEAAVMTEVQLKRLQLEAERSAARVVLLSEQARTQGRWALATQLRVKRASASQTFEVEVLKGHAVGSEPSTPGLRAL